MSISQINNNTEIKQHLILASVGGTLWGTVKGCNIYKNIKSTRDTFQNLEQKNFGLRDEKLDLLDEKQRLYDEAISLTKRKNQLLQKATDLAKQGEDVSKITQEINSISITEHIEFEAQNNVNIKRDTFIKEQKKAFQNKIKNLKKNVVSKLAIRFLGGAAIGLTASYLITHFKNKK